MLNRLAEKYWRGECSELEERHLREALKSPSVPEHLKDLSEYLASTDVLKDEEMLGQDFDQDILAAIQAQEQGQSRPWRNILSMAASVVIVLGMAVAFNLYAPTTDTATALEFTDTYDDAELAFQEVKKVMMLLSSNMNEGMDHAGVLGEFHQATQTLDTNKN